MAADDAAIKKRLLDGGVRVERWTAGVLRVWRSGRLIGYVDPSITGSGKEVQDKMDQQGRVPFDYKDLVRLLKINDGSLRDDYVMFEEDDKIFIAINDSDLFAWGYSGAIDITPADLDGLEQAYKDTKAAVDCGEYWAPRLYCCRKVGKRPQGAAYPKDDKDDEKLWPLFDACGPGREVGYGNPTKHPRDVEPDPPAQAGSWKCERCKFEVTWDGLMWARTSKVPVHVGCGGRVPDGPQKQVGGRQD